MCASQLEAGAPRRGRGLPLSGLAGGGWFVLPEEPAGVSREERILLRAGQGSGVRHEGACGSRGTGTRGPRGRAEVSCLCALEPPPLAGVSSAPVPLWGAHGPRQCLLPLPAPCGSRTPRALRLLASPHPSLQPPAVTPGRRGATKPMRGLMSSTWHKEVSDLGKSLSSPPPPPPRGLASQPGEWVLIYIFP